MGQKTMSGYQFAHVDGYGRKGGKNGTTKERVLSMSEIAAEAERHPDAIPHIENPQPPILRFGVLPSEVVKEAEEWAKTATDAIGRKLRIDGMCMDAGVVSFPADRIDEWPAYRDEAIEWLKTKYGDHLKSVVEHTDEPYPHIHFYVVPKKGEKFESIHEGYAAMNAVPKEAPRIDRKNAFGKAMTAWQDEVYLAFGLKYGLARTGPRRQRLTRAEWQEQQKAYRLLGKTAGNAKVKLDPKEMKAILESVKPTHKAGFMGKGEDLYTLDEVKEIVNAAALYTRREQYNAKMDFVAAAAKADAEINAEALQELGSLKNQVVELKQTIIEKEASINDLQASFDKRGTAISNAVHQVKQLEGQLDNALTLSVEWKSKYQQEHVKANGLARDLSDKEDELRELKREYGLGAGIPKLSR